MISPAWYRTRDQLHKKRKHSDYVHHIDTSNSSTQIQILEVSNGWQNYIPRIPLSSHFLYYYKWQSMFIKVQLHIYFEKVGKRGKQFGLPPDNLIVLVQLYTWKKIYRGVSLLSIRIMIKLLEASAWWPFSLRFCFSGNCTLVQHHGLNLLTQAFILYTFI